MWAELERDRIRRNVAAGRIRAGEIRAAGLADMRARRQEPRRCYCPDDCACHYPWRLTLCGCRGHA